MNKLTDDNRRMAACPNCDLLYYEAALQSGEKLRCPRCGTILRVSINNSIEKTLALNLTGLILYIPAMTMPIMTISIMGLEGKSSVIQSLTAIMQTGYFFVGIAVALVSVIFPLVKLTLLFFVALFLKFKKKPSYLASLFRMYKHLSQWGMVEVYMLSILVSIIKMHSLGTLDFNIGFFCFFALCLVTVASSAVVDEHLFWQRIDAMEGDSMAASATALTASEAGLIRCHDCGVLVYKIQVEEDEILRCPRCRAEIYGRRSDSINTTWALLVCAIILFLPANISPIMRVDFLGSPEVSTIMDGIIYFFQEGEYFVGTIILIASVLVPLFKIVGLMIILLSIRYGWSGWLKHKAKMFRFVEFIGRWSFLDVFVIALLAAVVNFGVLSSIAAHSGARYFTAVVITTMFAAISFDPRILWDTCEKKCVTKEEKNG